jgi:type IV pilus assembly protein PilF
MKFIKNIFLILLFAVLTSCIDIENEPLPLNPEAAKYNAQLGLAYLQQGDVSRAKSKFLLALQQAPEDPLVLDSMGYFLDLTGQSAAAEKYYLLALAIEPQDGASENNYGGYLCRNHRSKEAIQHFLLAAQDIHYLNTASAYENAGICALKIPDKKLAKQYLQQALVIDPNLISAKKALVNI